MPEEILIVDDERAIAQLTAMWVKHAGFSALIANDGQQGLAAALNHRPDLILLDIRMPDLDGFEVNRRLKENPDLKDIPVIFLSAHAQESARHEAAAAGTAGFLTKPCEFHDLIAAIRHALAQAVNTASAL